MELKNKKLIFTIHYNVYFGITLKINIIITNPIGFYIRIPQNTFVVRNGLYHQTYREFCLRTEWDFIAKVAGNNIYVSINGSYGAPTDIQIKTAQFNCKYQFFIF